MVNPQKENGYTAIANEILEQVVKTDILASEFRILLFIIRKTYGYQKKEDKISLTQFEKGTELSRATVVKALKNLVSRNILVKTAIPTYSFNKYYDKWVVYTAKLVKHNDKGSIARLTKIGIDGYTYKRKKEMTKETTEQSSEQIGVLIKSFEVINTNAKNFYARNPQRNACNQLIKDFGFDRVKSVIENTLPKTNIMEYMPTITTPIQLLEKWSSLEARILKLKGKQKEKSKIAFQ